MDDTAAGKSKTGVFHEICMNSCSAIDDMYGTALTLYECRYVITVTPVC